MLVPTLSTRAIGALLALALFAALPAPAAHAQSGYPERPVRLVVPFPAGGGADNLARAIAPKAAQLLGQPIVIDNRGGANGILGAEIVTRSAPDGHTLLATSFAFAVNPNVVRKMPFDVARDFLPVTNYALGTGYLLVAHTAFPAKTVKELMAAAKTRTIRYSTAGVGNGQHLAGALLASMLGADMTHVPYKG